MPRISLYIYIYMYQGVAWYRWVRRRYTYTVRCKRVTHRRVCEMEKLSIDFWTERGRLHSNFLEVSVVLLSQPHTHTGAVLRSVPFLFFPSIYYSFYSEQSASASSHLNGKATRNRHIRVELAKGKGTEKKERQDQARQPSVCMAPILCMLLLLLALASYVGRDDSDDGRRRATPSLVCNKEAGGHQ